MEALLRRLEESAQREWCDYERGQTLIRLDFGAKEKGGARRTEVY